MSDSYYHETELKCPYCDHSQMDAVYDGCAPKPFNDWESWECASCEKKFLVQTEIVFNFKKNCTANGSEHNFVANEDIFDTYKKAGYINLECANCPEYKLEPLDALEAEKGER